MNDKIYLNMQKHNKSLSKFATNDNSATFLKDYNSDIRTPFFRDVDKIIYSLSYLRYMDKTQVFIKKNNDHIQRRMIHVQYVSKIARTIGRALNLNEDLIEAAALGHDLGHTPFGHVGERMLDKISREVGEGIFLHNVNSVRNLLYVENYGKGLNVTIETLDAIMCHNGEIVSNEYYPKKKNKDDFLKEYYDCYKDIDTARYLRPMTLEGCVVRVSDIIAYLGRDIEDAVRMNIISWDDVPESITRVLGNSNSEIVNTIILDIIKNSENKNYLSFSDEVFNAVKNLKKFNYDNIYNVILNDKDLTKIEKMFRKVFNDCLNELNSKNKESNIYTSFLNSMDVSYLENSNERIVLDYIAGMTDDYFIKSYEKDL